MALNNLTAGDGVPSHYYRDNSATGNCTDGDPNQTGTVGRTVNLARSFRTPRAFCALPWEG
ncbi:MAG: hypothetical protein HZY76_16190 [Anaerolineae bacterium]|nr:MAG: hypothetical protein HZY76_16190 [Anaerolineae bacterium]